MTAGTAHQLRLGSLVRIQSRLPIEADASVLQGVYILEHLRLEDVIRILLGLEEDQHQLHHGPVRCQRCRRRDLPDQAVQQFLVSLVKENTGLTSSGCVVS